MATRFLQSFKHLRRMPEVAACRALTPQWKKLTCAYLGLKVTYPFQVELHSCVFVFQTLADVRTFWPIFFSGIYEVEPDDCLILDAGANVGAFTLYALLRAPRALVVAIEPAPDSCARVREMVKRNGFEARCEIHEKALAVTEGVTNIDLSWETQFRKTGIGETIVGTSSLDAIVGSRKVDLLKLDIEGAEYTVLESSQCLRDVARLAMEYHPAGSIDSVIRSLETVGLEKTLVREDGEGYGIATFRHSMQPAC